MATGEEHHIGDWRFDVAGAALVGPTGERRLEHRAARTLELLCRRRGETVTHREILAEVWESRAVSRNSVAVVIADLRRLLGDDAGDPRHIARSPSAATGSTPNRRPMTTTPLSAPDGFCRLPGFFCCWSRQ